MLIFGQNSLFFEVLSYAELIVTFPWSFIKPRSAITFQGKLDPGRLLGPGLVFGTLEYSKVSNNRPAWNKRPGSVFILKTIIDQALINDQAHYFRNCLLKKSAKITKKRKKKYYEKAHDSR